MSSCNYYLLMRLACSNLKVMLYVLIWSCLIGPIVFKIFNSDSDVGINIVQYTINNTPANLLQYAGIFTLGVFILNSLYLIYRDIQNYTLNRHQLDDPKIRSKLLIEAINASQTKQYYLEELRADYFRLAYRERSSQNSSRTVIDGNITVIKKQLFELLLKLSSQQGNRLSLCCYNKKCLDLCNIKHFNLVKGQLHL